MTRVYPPYAEVSRAEIAAMVEAVLRDESPYGSIDAAITAALYPGGAPRHWADWHEHAKDIHLEAVECFGVRRKTFIAEMVAQTTAHGHERRRFAITTQKGWEVVNQSLAQPPALRLTWGDLGKRLGVQPRAAEHLIKGRLGFRFVGRYETRAIERGPCIECGKLHPMGSISERRHGPCCLASQAA